MTFHSPNGCFDSLAEPMSRGAVTTTANEAASNYSGVVALEASIARYLLRKVGELVETSDGDTTSMVQPADAFGYVRDDYLALITGLEGLSETDEMRFAVGYIAAQTWFVEAKES